MRTKQLAAGIKGAIGKIDLSAPAEYLARLAAGFLLARGKIFGTVSPFGIAFAAASLPTAGGVASFLGAALGYLSEDIGGAVRYIAAAVIIRAIARLAHGTEISEKRFFQPLTATAVTSCVGFVYLLDGGIDVYETALFAVETALVGGLTFFYAEAMSALERYPWKSADAAGRTAGAIFLLASALASLAGITFFAGISVGRILAVLAVMLASFRGGVSRGAAAGIIFGAAMDMAHGGTPYFTVAYGTAALIAGVFPKSGRFIFDLTFIMANALSAVWMWGTAPTLASLYEMFVASVIFLLLPDTVLAKVSAVFPAEADGYGFLKAREYTRRRTELASDAFQKLYETVRIASGDAAEGDAENVAGVFDRAAESVCRACGRAGICWQRNYSDTADIMNRLTPKVTEPGAVGREDFPPHFADGCKKLDRLIDAINGEARILRCRRQFRRRLAENRGAAYQQYADVAAILKNVSRELGSEVRVEPALEKRLVKYLRGIDIDASAAVFRLPGGKMRIELRSPALYALRRDKNWLNKISAVMETPLCTAAEGTSPEYAVLTEAEPLAAEVGASSMRKAGESVSGDRGVYFRTDEGIIYVLLADGMGTGEGAAECAGAAVGVLESFLRAGIEPELALGVLGDVLFLENDDKIVSATVDLMRADLFTGEVKIYKYGAAPTYFKRGMAVKRVECGTFPAGFVAGRETRAYAKAKLAEGAFAVMVSDGVTGGGDDAWLRTLISRYDGDDAKELSGLILTAAAERGGARDDMTALVMRIDARK